MAGYAVKVEEPEPEQFAEHPGRREKDGIFFVEKRQMEETFSIPMAFSAYTRYFRERFWQRWKKKEGIKYCITAGR